MQYEIVHDNYAFPIYNEKNDNRYVDFYEHLRLGFHDNKQYGGNFVADIFVLMWYYQDLNDDGSLRDGGFKFNTGNKAALDAIGKLPASDKITLNKID